MRLLGYYLVAMLLVLLVWHLAAQINPRDDR